VSSGGVISSKPQFVDDDRIVFCEYSGLWILDSTHSTSELLFDGNFWQFAVSEDGRRIVVTEQFDSSELSASQVLLLDAESRTRTLLSGHGDQLYSIAMDAAGTVVATGDMDGVLRVGPTSDEEPHLLLGHEGRIWSVDIDPLGRWIASGGEDGTVRIWPMPDLSEPPLHALPHDELLAKLKSLTNLRVVRDNESSTGWTITHEPFPSWESAPRW
jgi:WD40 repeat protein